jgi:hypothetical protein
MAKFRVHVPEQTIIIDGDLLNGDPLSYWEEHARSLIMWDGENGAFTQVQYELEKIAD